MEPEQKPHGRDLRLCDVLAALRQRGRNDEAERYEQRFLRQFSPPMTREQVLESPFDGLCKTLSLFSAGAFFSQIESRVHRLKQEPGTTSVVYGEHYLKLREQHRTGG